MLGAMPDPAAPLGRCTWRGGPAGVQPVARLQALHLWYAIRLCERGVVWKGGAFYVRALGVLYRERERRNRQAAREAAIEAGQAPEARRAMHYVLKDGKPVKVPLLEWAAWFEASTRPGQPESRRIAWTEIGGVQVSTVFLGLDHNFGADGPPILWETMVFGGVCDGTQRRYASREAALEGHEAIVDAVTTAEESAEKARAEAEAKGAAVERARRAAADAQAAELAGLAEPGPRQIVIDDAEEG